MARLLPLLLQHLDSPGTLARILIVDSSSAFSIIQRHVMIQTLHHLNTPSRLIYLLHSFLSDRLQGVHLDTTTSPALNTVTGAPQGCVLHQ